MRHNKMGKFKVVFLALVCFISGIVVCFEWMGHDKGQRFYSMFKRPEYKEVEVIKVQRVPIVISDDLSIVAINQNYRESLIKISGIQWDGHKSKDGWVKTQSIVNDSLRFVNTIIKEEN